MKIIEQRKFKCVRVCVGGDHTSHYDFKIDFNRIKVHLKMCVSIYFLCRNNSINHFRRKTLVDRAMAKYVRAV